MLLDVLAELGLRSNMKPGSHVYSCTSGMCISASIASIPLLFGGTVHHSASPPLAKV